MTSRLEVNKSVFFKKSMWILRKNFILLTITLCFLTKAYAQELEFKVFNATDGLPSNTVYGAFQDSKGFIWFTTESGVSRFDGYNFKNFTVNDGLSDNEVFGAYEDSKGRIWFRTFNGKVSYWYKGRIVNADVDPGLKPLNADSKINAIVEDRNGNIWIAHEHFFCGLYTSDNKAYQLHIKDDSYLFYMWLDDQGYPYGVLDKDIVKFYDNDLTKLKFEIVNSLDNFAQRILFHNNKLITTAEGKLRGVSIYENVYDKRKSLAVELPGYQLTNFSVTSQNDLWVCTYNGVKRFNNNYLDVENATHYLLGTQISSVLQDISGNYWFTSLDKGVFYGSEKRIKKYDQKNGLFSASIISIASGKNGEVWLGHADSGLSHVKNGQVSSIPLSQENSPYLSKIRALVKSHNSDTLYICASSGLYRQVSSNSMTKLIAATCVCFSENDDGVKYFGTAKEIYKINNTSFSARWQNVPINEPHLGTLFHLVLDKRVSAVNQDNFGNVWYGCNDDLIKIDEEGLHSMKEIDDYFDCRIKDLKSGENGKLWVATDGKGLLIYDGDGVKSIAEDQGLSSNICNSIYLENDTTAWVATNRGVNKVVITKEKMSIKYLNKGDGLSSDQINDLIMANDSIWVATGNGLNVFHKSLIYSQDNIPVVNITDFRVVGESMLGTTINSFNHQENNIEIDFVGLAYNNTENIRYRYSLQNHYNPNLFNKIVWQYTKNTVVEFSSLNPGNYTFLLSARLKNGTWNAPKLVRFVIEKPYWQNYWFIGFFGVMMIVGIWQSVAMYYSYRRKKFLLKQRLLESKLQAFRAQINPHFMFNALNSIQKFFMNNQVYDAQSYLAKFSRLMRLIVDNSDKNELTVEEELNVLKHYLDIEQLRVNNKFRYVIEVDDTIDSTYQNIPTMIIQPFVENAIWHGIMPKTDPGVIKIKIFKPKKRVTITVEDNGIGRKESIRRKVNNQNSAGIRLVKERLAMLSKQKNSKFSLHILDLEDASGEGLGTKVEIIIP